MFAKCHIEFDQAMDSLDQVALLVDLACEDETKGAIHELGLFMRRIGRDIAQGQPEIFMNSLNTFQWLMNAVNQAMRKEMA